MDDNEKKPVLKIAYSHILEQLQKRAKELGQENNLKLKEQYSEAESAINLLEDGCFDNYDAPAQHAAKKLEQYAWSIDYWENRDPAMTKTSKSTLKRDLEAITK